MGTKHIHAEVIKAWADGEEIEIFIESQFGWCKCQFPSWDEENTYRVKPKNIVVPRLVCFSDETTSVLHFDVSKQPNVQYTFNPEGKLVSVEMIK